MEHGARESGQPVRGRGVLSGAFAVLRALPELDGPHQVARLAQATGIPRPTVHRLLAQLLAEDAVEHAGGRYRLSPGLLALSHRVEPTAGLRSAAAGVIQAVREQTGATVSLVVPSGGRYVALEMVPGREVLPFDGYDGAVMPAASAAEVVMSPCVAPQRLRPAWGAAVDEESVMTGITCYAVAITLPGRQSAALQVAATARTGAEHFAPVVHRAATLVADRAARAARTSVTPPLTPPRPPSATGRAETATAVQPQEVGEQISPAPSTAEPGTVAPSSGPRTPRTVR